MKLSCSFEKTLKQKLAQKSTGMASEESVLLKAFKYFDLNNNGTVEPDEFAKAIEKIGIMIPTKQVSHDLRLPQQDVSSGSNLNLKRSACQPTPLSPAEINFYLF